LPILISVSLAPGSYFFCADAAVAAIAAAAANTARVTSFLGRAGIVFSHVAIYFDQVSQAAPALASIGLFRRTKRHCCREPIMIDARLNHDGDVIIAASG
jgi:hypothetical protein